MAMIVGGFWLFNSSSIHGGHYFLDPSPQPPAPTTVSANCFHMVRNFSILPGFLAQGLGKCGGNAQVEILWLLFYVFVIMQWDPPLDLDGKVQ
jgi:hypothetical protein